MKKKSIDVKINVPECKGKAVFVNNAKCGSGLYGLGFIGSAVYYISTATSFWMGVLGVIKAIFWPAFLVYGLLKFLGA